MTRTVLPSTRPLPLLFTAAMFVISGVDAADGEPACGARLQGAFVESAPRDRFEFVHGSPAGWTVGALRLDLAGSAGRLVFDTEEGGVGVEVFQSFRAEAGSAKVRAARLPADGGTRLELDFGETGAGETGAGTPDAGTPDAGTPDADAFAAGETFVFSIDVDDRLADSELGQIRVSGSEIEGGRLGVDFVHGDGITETLTGYFGEDARVELVGTPCPG